MSCVLQRESQKGMWVVVVTLATTFWSCVLVAEALGADTCTIPYKYLIEYKVKDGKTHNMEFSFMFKQARARPDTRDGDALLELWEARPQIMIDDREDKSSKLLLNDPIDQWEAKLTIDEKGDVQNHRKAGLHYPIFLKIMDRHKKTLLANMDEQELHVTFDQKRGSVQLEKDASNPEIEWKSEASVFEPGRFKGTLKLKNLKESYKLRNFRWIPWPRKRGEERVAKCVLEATLEEEPYIDQSESLSPPSTISLPSKPPDVSKSSDPISSVVETLLVVSSSREMRRQGWVGVSLESAFGLISGSSELLQSTGSPSTRHNIAIVLAVDGRRESRTVLLPSNPIGKYSEAVIEAKKKAGLLPPIPYAGSQRLEEMLIVLPKIANESRMKNPNIILVISTEWGFSGRISSALKEKIKELNMLPSIKILYLGRHENDRNKAFDEKVIYAVTKSENGKCGFTKYHSKMAHGEMVKDMRSTLNKLILGGDIQKC